MKISIAILLLCVGICCWYIWQSWPDQLLHIVMCDVGQGDAMLISYQFHQVLIDTGSGNQVLECWQQFTPWWDRHIEAIIITHDDLDHAGGLHSLLQYSSIGVVFRNPPGEETEFSQKLTNNLKDFQINTQFLTQGKKLSISTDKEDIQFVTLWPDLEHVSEFQKTETEQKANIKQDFSFEINDNNLSISGILTFGQFSLLTTGDIDTQVELAILGQSLTRDVDVIKIPHHGSKYSTSAELIAAFTPETAVIGVGKNNRFGHPSSRVIDLLRYSNIKTFTTSEHGHIHITTDGNSYQVLQSQD